MIRYLILCLLLFFTYTSQASYLHQFQLSATLAKYYQNVDGGYTAIPISGTQDVKVEVVDVALDQPIWSYSEEQYIENGSISMIIGDPEIDWVNEIEHKSLIFRISVLADQVDIALEFLPFSVYTEKANQFRQFNDLTISEIDYENARWIINEATSNAELAVSGSIVANKLIGSGSGLFNLTGPGFNDEHSLNSQDTFYKDVLYVDITGNVGVFTITPNARLHLKGGMAFQGEFGVTEEYILPTGNILFWDPNRAVFRSGVFNSQQSSADFGFYSIGFGEDVINKGLYSSILGGEDHIIDSSGIASIILGGQGHKIYDSYSIAAGGYLSRIWGEWSVLFGGYENISYGDYHVILGGEGNLAKGEYNLIIGLDNVVDSDYSIVIGSNNDVSGNRSVVLGNQVNIDPSYSHNFVYSNDNDTVLPTDSGQFIIFSDNGLGINKKPTADYSLDVSGNIQATQFIGDGQNLYNLQDFDSFWKTNNDGIYFLLGDVAVGTTNVIATLTVDGAITLGDSQQLSDGGTIKNGTLHFDEDTDLLQLYINDWITVNMTDLDTKLSFDSDDLNVEQSEIYYLKLIEYRDTVDRIFGSNGILINGLEEWFSDSGYYNNDLTWYESNSETRASTVIRSIIKEDEGSEYSYKWSGYFIPNVSDTYFFKTVSDQSSQVVINDVTVVNNLEVTEEGSIFLAANTAYELNIYFGEFDGAAKMNFYWKGGNQVEYSADLSSFFYVLADASYDLSQYGLFYEKKTVDFISISDKDASTGEILRYNGFDWYAHDASVWSNSSNGIYLLEQDFNVAVSENSFEYPLVIGTNPDLDGSNTEYPLVIGDKDSVIFSPRDHSMMFNLDYEDSSKLNYIKKTTSQFTPENYPDYGVLVNVENDIFKLQFTDKSYNVDEVVTLDTIFNLSSESMYLNTPTPQATFDSQGSVAFLNTYVDHDNFNDTIGLGHQIFEEIHYPYYLSLDDDYNLKINAGSDTETQPINFMIDGERKAYFNTDGELIIGDEEARAKLSIFDGGIALNVNAGQFGSTSYAGKRFTIASNSLEDPSIVFEYANSIIADLGDQKFAFGMEQSTSLLSFYSANYPNIKIQSEGRSRLIFEGEESNFTFQNNSGYFSLLEDAFPYLYIRSDSHFSLFSESISDISPISIDGDVEISNNDSLIFSNEYRFPIMSFSKDGNNLIIKQENQQPLKINSIDQEPILMVTQDGKVAIKSLTTTENAELYIVGDTLFNDVIYYRTAGDDKRIQAFSVSDNISEIRSVKELVIDEESGIQLEINSEDTITLSAPGLYEKIYDTTGNDYFVQPIGKDTLKFIQHETGLLVSLLDTNGDSEMDSIELYNTLIDGGVINGDVTVNGSVYVEKVIADGSEIYNIPFYWQLNGLDLYYSSGNVGISIASPNYELDVRDLVFTDQMYVSGDAYVQTIDFENSTLTEINDQDITFWVDIDDNDLLEMFSFVDQYSGTLLIFEEDNLSANFGKVGLYGKPDTNFHVMSVDEPTSMLLNGQSQSKLVLAGDTTTVNISLNQSSGIPDYGVVDQLAFQSTARMRFKVDGSVGFYISEYSVSIGDNTLSNSFYVNGNARVGAGYAEDDTIENAFLGMIVEGSGTVGNEIAAPGYQFFSKSNMSIGANADEIISDRDSFKGVVVEDRVGVGIDDSTDLLSMQGDMKIRDSITFYEDGLSQFNINSSGVFSVSSNITEDLIFQLSDYISFSIGVTRSITIHENSVSIGTITTQDDDSDLVIYDDENAIGIFEDTRSEPTVTFSSNNGTRESMMGLNENGDFLMESNGNTLADPDIVIQSSEVGIGKTPDYTLDVEGDVKSRKLYQTIESQDTRIYPVPIGAIMMWSGDKNTIPEGWFLCDGSERTDKYGNTKAVPDLRDKFIRGVGGDFLIGDQAGSHTLSTDIEDENQDGNHQHDTGQHEHEVSGDAHTHTAYVNDANYSSTTSGGATHGVSDVSVYDGSGDTQLKTSTTHSHSISSSHNHGVASISSAEGDHHDQSNTTDGSHSHTGGKHVHDWDNQPQYYVLAFIIKMY